MKRKTLIWSLTILASVFTCFGPGVKKLHAEYGEENLAPVMINDLKTQTALWNYLKRHSKLLNGKMIFWKAKVTKLWPNPDYPGASAVLIVNEKPDIRYKISFVYVGVVPTDSSGAPVDLKVGDVIRVTGSFLFYENKDKAINVGATYITVEK